MTNKQLAFALLTLTCAIDGPFFLPKLFRQPINRMQLFSAGVQCRTIQNTVTDNFDPKIYSFDSETRYDPELNTCLVGFHAFISTRPDLPMSYTVFDALSGKIIASAGYDPYETYETTDGKTVGVYTSSIDQIDATDKAGYDKARVYIKNLFPDW